MPELDEADAPLHEAAGDEHLPSLNRSSGQWRIAAVHFADVLGLPGNVKRVGRFHLHAVSELEGLDARLELGIFVAGASMLLVELEEQVELLALRLEGGVVVSNVLDELFDARVLRVD